MEFSIEDKQNYLRSQIMDQDYDAEEFLEFFKVEIGEDFENELEKLSKNQLESIVSKFKEEKNPANNSNEKSNSKLSITSIHNIEKIMGKVS